MLSEVLARAVRIPLRSCSTTMLLTGPFVKWKGRWRRGHGQRRRLGRVWLRKQISFLGGRWNLHDETGQHDQLNVVPRRQAAARQTRHGGAREGSRGSLFYPHRSTTFLRQLNRGRLRFAPARAYIAAMDREYWMKALEEAGRELDAAITRIDVNAAAKKLRRAKTELKSA
jgi:hypothetical protein